MSILQSFIHTPAAQALGWTLFHFLWEGAVLAALLLVLLLMARNASARLRYAMACGAMLIMAAAFVVTFFVVMPSPTVKLATGPRASAAIVGDWIAVNHTVVMPQTWADRLVWAGPFWLVGVLVFFLYRIGSWLAAERLRRVGTIAAPREWHERLIALTRSAGITRSVALLESCLADVPMVIGYLRPAIVAPLGMLAGLPSDQVEAILLHELAHIRRADYVVNLLQIAVEGLLFYHPAVWWVSSVVRAERENCCDDWAAEQHGDRHGYARALVTLEESPWRTPRTALAANGGHLLRRIRRLLRKSDGRDLAVPVLPAVLLVVSAGVALAAWAPSTPATQSASKPLPAPVQVAQAQHKGLPAARPAAKLPLATPYKKWLAEDVAYLISDGERWAFLKLQSDPEREHFIEQFWLIRDPTPNTLHNEFKEEHYRRIAYANEHFAPADGQTPGWRTARGRIYIMFGPPDTAMASMTGAFSHVESWTYRYLEGLGANTQLVFSQSDHGDTMDVVSPSAPVATFTGVANGIALPNGHIIVQTFPAGLVRFQIPDGYQAPEFQVLSTLRISPDAAQEPSRGYVLQQTGVETQLRRARFGMGPGSYVWIVAVIEKSTGKTYSEAVQFEIKKPASPTK